MRSAVQRGIANQVSQLRHLATSGAGGRVEENEDYLLFAGGHPYPGTYTNGAIRKTTAIGANELIVRADVFFGGLGRQYYLWAENDRDADLTAAARARGYWPRPPDQGNPCIVCEQPLTVPPEPAGFTISAARDDDDRRAYLGVIMRNYDLEGMDASLAEAVLFSVASLRSDSVLVLLARRHDDSQVCAAISGFLADDCVGLEWAATDPSARGHGLGSALIARATRWGFENGASSAWGVASQQGVPIWRGLGFDVPTHFRRFLAHPPPVAAPAVRRGRPSLRSSRPRGNGHNPPG